MKKCLLGILLIMLWIVGTVSASDLLYFGVNAFTVSVTNIDSQDGVTVYFDKYKPTLSGVWFFDPNKELNPSQVGSHFQSPSPCFAGFMSEDDANEIWIYDGAFLWTENPKSKNEKFLFVGTGIFLDLDAGVSAAAYIDASGTYKQDNSGNILSMTMKGKVGAGMQANEIYPFGFFVLNGQFNVTLKPEEWQE